MKMMTPNNLELVRKELATISRFENGFVIPEEVQATPKNDHYYLIGIRSSQGKTPRHVLTRGKLICIHQNQYRKMQRQVKNKILKSVLGGTWQEVYILHDPTKKAAKKEDKVKNLSPAAKGKVKKLFAEDKTAEEIANELGEPLDAVTKYINEKLK